MSKDLRDLLERSKQLVNHIDQNAVPMLRRPLNQIDQASKKLHAKSSRYIAAGGDVARNKARFLLAGRGVDAEKMSQTLSTISLKTTLEPLEPLTETDVAGYLKHQHRMIILSAIEEAKSAATASFEKHSVEFMDEEWRVMKDSMLNTLSHQARQNVIPPNYISDTSALYGSTMSAGAAANVSTFNQRRDVSNMSERMLHYSRWVSELNAHRMAGDDIALANAALHMTVVMAERFSTEARSELVSVWSLVKCLVGETNTENWNFGGSLPYRLEAPSTLVLIERVLQFLGKQLLAEISGEVESSARYSALERGGSIGVQHDVDAFLRMKRGDPRAMPAGYVWASIYYCLRCNDINAAIAVARENTQLTDSFARYLDAFSQSQLTPDMLRDIESKHAQLVNEQESDQYEILLYNIVGCCRPELSKQQGAIINKLEDYIWFKLMMIVSSFRNPSKQLTSNQSGSVSDALLEFQSEIVKHGPSYFNENFRTPLRYFLVLLYSLQFGRAIQFLVSADQYSVEAVHVAIVLDYYNMLPLPDLSYSTSLFTESPYEVRVHVGQLIKQYVRAFSRTDPKEALQYLTLIGMGAAGNSSNYSRLKEFRDDAIVRLVLESREYELLLGSRSPTGEASQGLLNALLPEPEVKEIVLKSAEEASRTGYFEDAIKLYDLKEEYDQVIELLVEQVGLHLTSPSSTRDSLRDLVNDIAEIYERTGVRAQLKKSLCANFELIMNLFVFFDYYHAHEYSMALQVIRAVNLFPMESYQVESKVRSHADMHHSILRNMKHVILNTMNCIKVVYQHTRRVNPSAEELGELKEFAKALRMYSTRLGHNKIPSDVSAQLLRIEVELQ